MKSIRSTLGAIIAFFTMSQALAQTPAVPLTQPVQCPSIGDEFNKLLGRLESIKTKIKKTANCENVDLTVKSLEDLLVKDREKFLEIIEIGRTQPLNEEQTNQVRKYAENITLKVTSIYDLFTQANSCFNDGGSITDIQQLSGFVSEVSRLVAAVSGPWATPIALTGTVVAGFLTGMDKALKARAGFDFSTPSDWKSYVQNLCSFHNYREQIEHLLDPDRRIRQLSDLKALLNDRLKQMTGDCPDCRQIQENFNSEMQVTDPMVQSADRNHAKPLGTYTLYMMGLRDWADSEIKRVQSEAKSFWADVTGRHLLFTARDELERFLVDRESPRFLNHQTKVTLESFKQLNLMAHAEGRNLYYQIRALNPQAVGEVGYFPQYLDYFNVLVLQPIRWELLPKSADITDLQYAWTHYRDRNVNRIRATESSVFVSQAFCEFFRHAGYYTSAIRSACTSTALRNQASQIADLGEQLLAAGVVGQPSPIDPNVFNPGAGSDEKIPRTKLESLNLLVEQMTAR